MIYESKRGLLKFFWPILGFYTKNSPRNSWSPHFRITIWYQKSRNVGTSCSYGLLCVLASEALQEAEGTKKMFSRLFHQYSWNSEVKTTWKGLICWQHRTSTNYVVGILKNIFICVVFAQASQKGIKFIKTMNRYLIFILVHCGWILEAMESLKVFLKTIYTYWAHMKATAQSEPLHQIKGNFLHLYVIIHRCKLLNAETELTKIYFFFWFVFWQSKK